MNGRVSKLIRKMVYGELDGKGERTGRKYAVLADRNQKGQHLVCLDPRAIYLAMKNEYRATTDDKQREKLRIEAGKSAKPIPGHRQVHDGVPRFMGDVITVQDPPEPVRKVRTTGSKADPCGSLPRFQAGREACCIDGSAGTCNLETCCEPSGEGMGLDTGKSNCKCSNAEGGG